MARRNTQSQSTPTEAPEETTVSTTTENVPETTEGVEAAVEAEVQDAPKADKKADTPIDLTAFQAVATTASENADSATGEVAPAFLEPVVKEYRLLDGIKAKNAAKAWLVEQMKAQMEAQSIVGARSYLQLSEGMTAGSASHAPKAPTDPTEAFVQAEATLRLAAELHTPGEGVADDNEAKVVELVDASREKATTYLAWLQNDAEDKGDEPEVTAVIKNAVKLAVGKAAKVGGRTNSGSAFTGERRDIAKHIQSAFEGVEDGTFLTVAEIRKHTSEEYGDNPPSAGAISARLFPSSGKCTVEGVEPSTNDKGNKGATKVA
jgi:hypothetical protein